MSEYEKADKEKKIKSYGNGPKVEIPREEIEKVHKGISAFKGNLKKYGHLYSPFEQYLESIRVISFREYEGIVVHDPGGYHRVSEIANKVEYREYHKDQDFFNQNPEAKEDHLRKIADLKKGLSDKFKV